MTARALGCEQPQSKAGALSASNTSLFSGVNGKLCIGGGFAGSTPFLRCDCARRGDVSTAVWSSDRSHPGPTESRLVAVKWQWHVGWLRGPCPTAPPRGSGPVTLSGHRLPTASSSSRLGAEDGRERGHLGEILVARPGTGGSPSSFTSSQCQNSATWPHLTTGGVCMCIHVYASPCLCVCARTHACMHSVQGKEG